MPSFGNLLTLKLATYDFPGLLQIPYFGAIFHDAAHTQRGEQACRLQQGAANVLHQIKDTVAVFVQHHLRAGWCS